MMQELKGQWTKLAQSSRLQRSSHCLSVTNSYARIFGGEVRPREPVDNSVDIVTLSQTELHDDDLKTISDLDPEPSPRVGAASVSLQGNTFVFSGRGGVAMAPIEEQGAIWRYSGAPQPSWELIHPSTASNRYPQARSYHCMTSDGQHTLYLHGGCPESGRLSDLWAFDLETSVWKELASAPEPARGGASIAYSGGKLYRMNGFDGKNEQGGQVDIYSPTEDHWITSRFTADNVGGPSARSVGTLLPVTWNRRKLLLNLFGEQDPSSAGHAGAGKMLGDVWAWDTESHDWSRVESTGATAPVARGWFAADVLREEQDAIIVHGGLAEENNRLGDLWSFKLV